MADRQPPRCTIYKNQDDRGDGQLILVTGTLEEFILKCGTKLKVESPTALYTDTGVLVDEVELIQNNDILYVACNNDPFFRNKGDKTGKKKARAGGSAALYKIAILGGGGVGKSCLTLRFCRSKYVEIYDPTIEDSFHRHVVVDNRPAMLDILDTAGQEDFYVLRRQWIEDRDGFILVYSIADESTFAALNSFADLLREVKYENYDETPLVLVGNKADLASKREITVEDAQPLVEELGHATFYEASAKSGLNVNEIFHEIVRQFRVFFPLPEEEKKGLCTLLQPLGCLARYRECLPRCGSAIRQPRLDRKPHTAVALSLATNVPPPRFPALIVNFQH